MTTARLRAPRRAPAQPTSGLQASAACTCTQRKLAQSTPCTRTAVSGRTSSQGGALQPRSGTSQRAGGARTALPRLQAAQQQRRHALGQQGVQPLLRLRVERRRARRVERVQRAVDAAQRHLPGVHGLARAACGSAARSLQGSGLGLPARLPHAALQRRQAGAAPRLGCGGAHRSRACPAPWRGPGGRPRQRCRRPSGMRGLAGIAQRVVQAHPAVQVLRRTRCTSSGAACKRCRTGICNSAHLRGQRERAVALSNDRSP